VFFNANPYGNLPNSYLFHMQVKQQPGNNGGANQFAADTLPPITEEYIRNGQHKKQLQDRRNRLNTERSGSLHEMLLRLNRGRQEVNSLQFQLNNVQNPFQKRILEAQLGHKTAGTSFIEHSLSSSYDPGASGFVGSENRIDTIGSFVTSA